MAVEGRDLNYPALAFAAISGFLISWSIVSALWEPVKKGVKDYNKALEFLDGLSAAIIGCGGGTEFEDEVRDYSQGISGEPHDFLGMSKTKYERGIMNLSIVVGLGVAICVLLMGAGLLQGLIMGAVAFMIGYMLISFIEKDKMKTREVQQVRQFPFFLDIFLLTVQANGNIDDAIDTYREIFGYNALAQELVILQEDLKSHSLLSAFERLRNRVGDDDLRNILGELTQKLKTGTELQQTLEQQSDDMRALREELGAQAAERLNAKFNIPVVLAALATLLIFLAPAIAQMTDSGFL